MSELTYEAECAAVWRRIERGEITEAQGKVLVLQIIRRRTGK